MGKKKNKSANKAQEEHNSEIQKPLGIPIVKKENKEPMSIVLTPTNKKRLKVIATSVNMSASELIAYWIENQK